MQRELLLPINAVANKRNWPANAACRIRCRVAARYAYGPAAWQRYVALGVCAIFAIYCY